MTESPPQGDRRLAEGQAPGASRRKRVPVNPVGSPGQTASFETAQAEPATTGLRRLQEEDEFRREQARKLLSFFYRINIAVFSFVLAVWLIETAESWFAPGLAGHAHLITERVVLALIGGSVVQLGTLAVAVGRGMFRSG